MHVRSRFDAGRVASLCRIAPESISHRRTRAHRRGGTVIYSCTPPLRLYHRAGLCVRALPFPLRHCQCGIGTASPLLDTTAYIAQTYRRDRHSRVPSLVSPLTSFPSKFHTRISDRSAAIITVSTRTTWRGSQHPQGQNAKIEPKTECAFCHCVSVRLCVVRKAWQHPATVPLHPLHLCCSDRGCSSSSALNLRGQRPIPLALPHCGGSESARELHALCAARRVDRADVLRIGPRAEVGGLLELRCRAP